jgi:hypothetical protein
MAGPRPRQPEEQRRPSEVTIPRLSEQEIRDRSTRAFDRVVSNVLAPQLRSLNTDLTALRNRILEGQRALPRDASEEARNNALQASIDRFIELNPNSPLTAFIQAGNDVVQDFSFEWSGRRVTINLTLRTAEAEQWIRRPLDTFRANTINQIVQASQPLGRREYAIFFAPFFGMDSRGHDFRADAALVQQFATALSTELGIGPNQSVPRGHLPITIAYSDHTVRTGPGGRQITENGPTLRLEYAGSRTPG